MQAPSLLDVKLSELPVPGSNQLYRRRQLADWLYRHGVDSFGAMTNLPASWRQELSSRYTISPFARVERFLSQDGSVRYLFTLHDGKQTEAVYMPYRHRKTVCLSSMVGCPAGCRFCATGALGFGRNLTKAEILGQLLAIAKGEACPPRSLRNVVLMGMGEALLNFENAVGSIRTMIDPAALAMSPRRITVSTVGLPAKIVRLVSEQLPLVLAVSLHAPDDETRKSIIPTAHAYPIEEIIEALHIWQEAGGRRVTVEYTLLRDVNDHAWQAGQLLKRLQGLSVHINLIPFNSWPLSGFQPSSRAVTGAFKARLEAGGLSVSVRYSRGRDAAGACGQLALRRVGSDA
jgi:23S rRNA (adenine2503-C2)-methyltransferase